MADIYDEQEAVSQDEICLFSGFWSLVSQFTNRLLCSPQVQVQQTIHRTRLVR